MKPTRKHLAALKKLIVERHPRDTPEFLVVPLDAGNAQYLKWITDSVAGSPKTK